MNLCPNAEQFVCVAKCEELDYDGSAHCHRSQQESDAYARYPDGCPCGNKPDWQPIIGRTFFASGETTEFTCKSAFIAEIREELPYSRSSGFRFKVESADPAIRKAVDDEIYNLHGLKNPRRKCNYGLSEVRSEPIHNNTNQNLPHTYQWFFMKDRPETTEGISLNLTLDEAIDKYRASNSGNKRVGVTKDGRFTVDIIVTVNGEEEFLRDYERLNCFSSDSLIAAAAERLENALMPRRPSFGKGGYANDSF